MPLENSISLGARNGPNVQIASAGFVEIARNCQQIARGRKRLDRIAVVVRQRSKMLLTIIAGSDNVRSIGARVTVERDGPRLPVRVAVPGLGLMGDPAPEFTFGLGESGEATRVRVTWADGKETVIERPTLNTVLHVR